ncbi:MULTISPECIES: hypothetical protein [unclassified Methylobacterium]|uniref:hypothetical protein n=1 Tax=unclassified Methylobacterium TaxID=2615210 RepID=UPI0005B7FCFE|nr:MULTISPECIES: hypothetical protein [unclassified Methylobacterium]SFU67889.1 hypothetical protein SAMN02799643_01768 [Methylobacterium sp. UNCCL125]
MSVSFAEKMRLFRAIMADPSLPALAKNVGAVLLLHFHNASTGRCNPPYEQLGEACGVKKRATILAVLDLEAAAWIAVERRGGRHKPNQFAFRFDRLEKVHTDAPFEGEETVHACAPIIGERVHGSVRKGAQACTRTEKNNPPASPVGGEGCSPGPVGPGFSEFWDACRHKVAEVDARAEFERVVATGEATAADLVAAMRRHAEATAGRTHHVEPKTWLRKKRWLDVPAPPRAAGTESRGQSRRESYLDMAQRIIGGWQQ